MLSADSLCESESNAMLRQWHIVSHNVCVGFRRNLLEVYLKTTVFLVVVVSVFGHFTCSGCSGLIAMFSYVLVVYVLMIPRHLSIRHQQSNGKHTALFTLRHRFWIIQYYRHFGFISTEYNRMQKYTMAKLFTRTLN